ncbi:tRNA pseudouridine(55) synthase TruB [Halobacillus sp. Marseille-Q1614]|uniref:tRNA pseudouridine(55) synthase TruB n=1 Tax=Halobacillus sp. Marseille-Q1614 TaxID=2709134 RepID=UPI0015712853|nr:tRNA pseudouridine(55) synthase TruB [Halobacillus sp. Marseille-Q1614]
MNGILPLWKEKGFTSHDCVSKARGMLKTKKIGHTGTLDPEVEGVLPLCIGRATKIVPFLTDTKKVYEATVTLGFATETEDQTGEEVERASVDPVPSNQDIDNVLSQFKGEITQIPPMYSAVKVNGKRLYQYAREGKEVERPKRKVTIHEIGRLSDIEKSGDTCSFSIKASCSKGTYIRTLCVDIGKALGFPAHMSSLERLQTGDIKREDCFTFEEVQLRVDQGDVKELILPLDRGLNHLETLIMGEDKRFSVENGQVLPRPKSMESDIVVVKLNGEALAIYQQHPTKHDKIKPIRVF